MKDIKIGAVFLLAALTLWLVQLSGGDQALAGRIRDDVLRFHVIGASNRQEDQELKLQVRSLLLEEIETGMEGQPSSKETLVSYINLHKLELKKEADDFIRSQGFDYESSVEVGVSHFPTKFYGDMLFPAGDYDAVRVVLGKGKGRNWWCVLYPSLCFVSDTAAVVPDSSKAQLAGMLAEEDYASLFSSHPDIRISFRLLEWWNSSF